MRSTYPWAIYSALVLSLGYASAGAQPARGPLPPLPSAATLNLPPLDGRALEALKPLAGGPAVAPPAPLPSTPKALQPAGAQVVAPAPPAKDNRIFPAVRDCKVTYRPLEHQLNAGPDATELKITFTGDKSCLTAVSADQLWAEAALRTFKQEVHILLEENTGASDRTARVFVVAGSEQLEFRVTQRARVNPPLTLPPTPAPLAGEPTSAMAAHPGTATPGPADASPPLDRGVGPGGGTVPAAEPEAAQVVMPEKITPRPTEPTAIVAAPLVAESAPSPGQPTREVPPTEPPPPLADKKPEPTVEVPTMPPPVPSPPAKGLVPPGEGYEEVDLSEPAAPAVPSEP